MVVQLHGEQRIEVGSEGLGTSLPGDEGIDGVWHVEAVVPGVSLDEALAMRVEGVEVLPEGTVGQLGPHEAD